MRELVEKAVIKKAVHYLNEDDIFLLESNLAAQEISCRNNDYLKMLALDDQFHATIFQACGMGRTWAMLTQLNYDFYRVRVLRLSHYFRWDEILQQHYAVFKALKNGEEDFAEEMMGNHLQMVIVESDELRSQFPDYFVDKK